MGAAAVCGNIVRTASLPNIASIFSAELHAICLAVNIIREVTQDKYVIYTDSMDSLQSIEQRECTHPVVKKIQYDCLGLLESGKEVSFCWIPSHEGIQANDAVDEFAKTASERSPEHIPIYYLDWYPILRTNIIIILNEKWTDSRRKQYEIHQSA